MAIDAAAHDATADIDSPPDAFVDCTRSPGAPVGIAPITGTGSTELSGLAASHTVTDLLYTHGDSGGGPDIFAVSATTGVTVGTLHLDGATATDWEDIATAPCAAGRCIYVADTGDNNLVRTHVSIFEVVEPAAAPVGAVVTPFALFDVAYPDGAHNVESLFVDPRDGASYAITKVSNPSAVVYAMPRTAGVVATAVELATLTIPSADSRVTAADMFVDACSARILVRSHDALYQLSGAPTATVPELLASPLVEMPVAAEQQGESVAWSVDGRAYFTTSEGANPPLSRVDD